MTSLHGYEEWIDRRPVSKGNESFEFVSDPSKVVLNTSKIAKNVYNTFVHDYPVREFNDQTETDSDCYERWFSGILRVDTVFRKVDSIELDNDYLVLDDQIRVLVKYYLFSKARQQLQRNLEIISDDEPTRPLYCSSIFEYWPANRYLLHDEIESDESIEQILDWLARVYEVSIKNPTRVTDYLSGKFKLVQIIKEVCLAVRQRFTLVDQLVLDLFSDRDSDDEFMTLKIRQARYTPDLLEILDELSEPFGERIASASGWFLLTTDFEEPEHWR